MGGRPRHTAADTGVGESASSKGSGVRRVKAELTPHGSSAGGPLRRLTVRACRRPCAALRAGRGGFKDTVWRPLGSPAARPAAPSCRRAWPSLQSGLLSPDASSGTLGLLGRHLRPRPQRQGDPGRRPGRPPGRRAVRGPGRRPGSGGPERGAAFPAPGPRLNQWSARGGNRELERAGSSAQREDAGFESQNQNPDDGDGS